VVRLKRSSFPRPRLRAPPAARDARVHPRTHDLNPKNTHSRVRFSFAHPPRSLAFTHVRSSPPWRDRRACTSKGLLDRRL
jgi:hypothetical protein